MVERAGSSAIHSGSPPISMTSASAASRSSSGAVTPNEQPASRWTSTGVPVNVIAGCRASGRAPARRAGSSTRGAVPPGGVHEQLARAVRRRSRRGRSTRPGRASSGTVSRTRSARASTSAGVDQRARRAAARRPGARRRRRRPDTATGRCPASCRDGGEGGADPARADDADGEPGGAVPAASRGSWVRAFTRRWPSVPVRGGYRTISRPCYASVSRRRPVRPRRCGRPRGRPPGRGPRTRAGTGRLLRDDRPMADRHERHERRRGRDPGRGRSGRGRDRAVGRTAKRLNGSGGSPPGAGPSGSSRGRRSTRTLGERLADLGATPAPCTTWTTRGHLRRRHRRRAGAARSPSCSAWRPRPSSRPARWPSRWRCAAGRGAPATRPWRCIRSPTRRCTSADAWRSVSGLRTGPPDDASRGCPPREEVRDLAEPFGTLMLELPLRDAGFVLPHLGGADGRGGGRPRAGCGGALRRRAAVGVRPALRARPLPEIAALADSVYVSFYKSLGGLSGRRARRPGGPGRGGAGLAAPVRRPALPAVARGAGRAGRPGPGAAAAAVVRGAREGGGRRAGARASRRPGCRGSGCIRRCRTPTSSRCGCRTRRRR